MIYKLEKIDRTISSIIRKLQIGSEDIPHLDFVEWIAEAIEHIGSYYQFEEKTSVVIIDDYVGYLPCDLHELKRIKNHVTVNRSSFNERTFTQYLAAIGVIDTTKMSRYERFNIELPMSSFNKPEFTNPNIDGITHNNSMISPSQAMTSKDYNINFDKITTAFQYGMLEVKYLAIPIDERGFPLIPDNQSFRDALFWRCAYFLSMGSPELLKNPQMRDIEFTESRWHFYCAQARASANYPNIQMIERMKNNYMRLLNTVDDDVNGYANLGKRQILNLDGH